MLSRKTNTALFLGLILLLQITILAIMVLNSYVVLLWGEEISLEVVPVDPRSLFSGDYVQLDYTISRLDLQKVPHDFNPERVKPGQPVYLSLTEQKGVWEPASLTLASHKVQNQTYLKGKVRYIYEAPDPLAEQSKEREPALTTLLSAEWGIEQYFVPEGKGLEIERKIREGKVYAKVAVWRGKARLTGLQTE